MKTGLFIVVCLTLAWWTIVSPGIPDLAGLGSGDYCIYSTQVVANPLITHLDDTGFSYIYHCKSTNASKLRGKFTKIDGESITLKSLVTYGNTPFIKGSILKKLGYSEVSESTLGSVTTVYAYSGRGRTFIHDAGGKKINLEIALNGTTLTVGWPVILGSY